MPLRFLITSGDVLHAWAIPQLGIKIDAVPGRLNQFISFIYLSGIFYGQCSELCGVAHGFMPIVVWALPNQYFINYLLNTINFNWTFFTNFSSNFTYWCLQQMDN